MRKLLSLMLILIASGALTGAPVFGKSSETHEKAAAKIKHKITRLGVDAPVMVKLADATKLNGRIGEINENSFLIRLGANGDEQVIKYSDVQQVNYVGSTGGANLGPAFLVFGAVILLIKLIH